MKRFTFVASILVVCTVLASSVWAQRQDKPRRSGPNAESRTPIANLPLAKDEEEKKNPGLAAAGSTRTTLRQRLRIRRPAAAAADRNQRRETGRRNRDFDGRIGHLVCPGPAQDGRQADHSRHRPGPRQVAAENFKKAGVDGLITIVLGDAHETVKRHRGSDRHPVPGCRQGRLPRLPGQARSQNPARRLDHRPQHGLPDPRSEILGSDHEEP